MRMRIQGVQRSCRKEKLVVEEELEIGLWKLSVWLEDLVTVRLFEFRYQDTTSEYWESYCVCNGQLQIE
jgi:hypothetical protein